MEEMADLMLDAHFIQKKVTKTVTTAWIGYFRRAIQRGGFELMAKELYEICKPETPKRGREKPPGREKKLFDIDNS